LPEYFDVAVAGGGPAGAATALFLARSGWRTVLMEASLGSVERYGETLPPEINPLLRSLGLQHVLERSSPIESPGIVTRWGSPYPSEQDFIRNPHGSGWHLDRVRFDDELCREAERVGVTVRRGLKVTGCERRSDGWRIGGICSRAIVDAAGRNGLRLEGPSARTIDDTLLVLVIRVNYPEQRPPDLRTHIEAVREGWWYWTPLPDGESIAMYFTGRAEYRRAGKHSSEDLLDSAASVRSLVRSGRVAAARWIAVSSSIRKSICGRGWLAVGDSASCYDPLSGRGIFKAIRHGSQAAAALDRFLRGETDALGPYQKHVCREYRDYLIQRNAFYKMEKRWMDSAFWVKRS
jgi:flavin-dependent dehydrogenase